MKSIRALLVVWALSASLLAQPPLKGAIKFVTAAGAPVTGVSVTITIIEPNGKQMVQTATTDSTGAAQFSYKIKPKDPKGTWTVNASTVFSGVTYTGSTTFTVQ